MDSVQSKSLKSPTRSHFLAGPHSPQRGSSPPRSSESEESVLAVLTTNQDDNLKEMSPAQSCKPKTPEQPPTPPRPSTNDDMRVDTPLPPTDLDTKATFQPTSRKYDHTAKALDKRPIATPRREVERLSRPSLSPSLVNTVPRIGGTSHNSSHSPTSARASASLSPGRQRETPAVASPGSPNVTVRGTLYSGPSGLWKTFFKATIAKPVSAPGSPRDLQPPLKERSKRRSDEIRAELPDTRASLPSDKRVGGINPAQSTVVEPDLPGPSKTHTTPNIKKKSSVFATGELIGPVIDDAA